MGKIIAAEIANAQTRIALIDAAQLDESVPEDVRKFEQIVGLRANLGEMMRSSTLQAKVGKLMQSVTQGCADEVEGIGIGISSAVDRINIAHLTHQSGDPGGDIQEDMRPFIDAMRQEYKNVKQISVDNRSNLGAWGEYVLGWRPALNLNAKDLLFVTIGGNIGVGIITQGQILKGVNGVAGECGHLVLDPASEEHCDICHQNGCASKLASGRALVNYVKKHLDDYTGIDDILSESTEADGKSPTVDFGYHLEVNVKGTLREINARNVVLAFRGHSSDLATHAVDEMTTHLAKFITELAYILDPTMVIIGGVATADPGLGPIIDGKIHLRPYAAGGHELRTSALRDMATLYGAALAVHPIQPAKATP